MHKTAWGLRFLTSCKVTITRQDMNVTRVLLLQVTADACNHIPNEGTVRAVSLLGPGVVKDTETAPM